MFLMTSNYSFAKLGTNSVAVIYTHKHENT